MQKSDGISYKASGAGCHLRFAYSHKQINQECFDFQNIFSMKGERHHFFIRRNKICVYIYILICFPLSAFTPENIC